MVGVEIDECLLSTYLKNILKKIDKKIVQNLREKIDKEIDEAFNFAEQSPFPDYNNHKLNFHSK